MHRLHKFLFLLSFTLFAAPILVAENAARDETKTLSPYFFIKNADSSVDQMPLKSTEVKANVTGIIADVTVTQIYENRGKVPLEALYVFPASTRAAVHGLKMIIGERTITAKIAEREQARKEYEQARDSGRSASLLEQQRPNVFQMNVANILPGDVIKVILNYAERLVPTDGVYEFVYPTVVGPRYSEQQRNAAPATEKWVENPYMRSGDEAPTTLKIDVNLAAGMPIQEVLCNSHKTNIGFDGKAMATIALDKSELNGGNRDFILQYRLTGRRIETGMLLFEGEDENFFLMQVEPPKRVTTTDILPREYIFVVDVSGSMNGFPLDVSKALMRDLIDHLRPTDTFNVLLFASSSRLLSPTSLSATPRNLERAVHFMEKQRGGGGTRIMQGLQKALNIPKSENSARSVVIVTDGYISVETDVFDLIRENLSTMNVFAFGIGGSVNRFLIEGIARAGMGEPFIVTSKNSAAAQAGKFRQYIQSPLLSQVKVDFGTFEAYDVQPAQIPDVLAGRPISIFGKWRGSAKGEITVSGKTATGNYRKVLSASKFKASPQNQALRYLWARDKIARLADYIKYEHGKSKKKEQVTTLGLTYNLLTAYTSFVAIDSEIRTDGTFASVKQPLPLPQGVSDLAVGASINAISSPASLPPAYRKSRLRKQNLEPGQYVQEDKTTIMPEAAEEKAGTLHIRTVKIVVGTLKESVVKRVFSSHLSQIETELRASGQAHSSSISIALQIDASGTVTATKLRSGSRRFHNKRLEEYLSRLKFPAGSKGASIVVILQ